MPGRSEKKARCHSFRENVFLTSCVGCVEDLETTKNTRDKTRFIHARNHSALTIVIFFGTVYWFFKFLQNDIQSPYISN